MTNVLQLGNRGQKAMVAPPEPPYCGRINVHHNTVWFHTSEHERMATPGECAREILKTRARENYWLQLLRNAGWDREDLEALAQGLNRKHATATEQSEIEPPPPAA